MKTLPLKSLILTVLLALCLNPACVAQQQITGDWQGVLNAGGTQLHLVLHVAAAADGTLTATLDSPDQGAIGIPVSAISLADGKLSLTVDAVHGTYEGSVSKDVARITGTWSQGTPLALNFRRESAHAAAAPAAPSDIDGTWMGTLIAGTVRLRILFKIVNTAGGLTASLQSPDQSPVWTPASHVTRSGHELTIEINAIGAVYRARINAGLNSMEGTFTQRGNPMALALARVKD